MVAPLSAGGIAEFRPCKGLSCPVLGSGPAGGAAGGAAEGREEAQGRLGRRRAPCVGRPFSPKSVVSLRGRSDSPNPSPIPKCRLPRSQAFSRSGRGWLGVSFATQGACPRPACAHQPGARRGFRVHRPPAAGPPGGAQGGASRCLSGALECQLGDRPWYHSEGRKLLLVACWRRMAVGLPPPSAT